MSRCPACGRQPALGVDRERVDDGRIVGVQDHLEHAPVRVELWEVERVEGIGARLRRPFAACRSLVLPVSAKYTLARMVRVVVDVLDPHELERHCGRSTSLESGLRPGKGIGAACDVGRDLDELALELLPSTTSRKSLASFLRVVGSSSGVPFTPVTWKAHRVPWSALKAAGSAAPYMYSCEDGALNVSSPERATTRPSPRHDHGVLVVAGGPGPGSDGLRRSRCRSRPSSPPGGMA